MAPRRGAALTAPYRNSSLQSLLGVAREVLQQTARGLDPRLSSSALSTAVRAATALTSELDAVTLQTLDFTALWSHPGQDTAAYLALFSLALRRSSPMLTGQGTECLYACLLADLSRHLAWVCHLTEPVPQGHSICRDLLGPVLLRAGALECYSRLLADAAGKLKPAAAAALAEHSWRAGSRSSVEAFREDAVAAVAGGRHQPAQERRQPQNTQAFQPIDSDCLELANTTHILLAGLIGGVFQSANGSGGSSSGGGGGTSSTGGSSSGGGGSGASGGGDGGGSSSNAASACTKYDLMHDIRTQLRSSWVLENWAQVLLLIPAAASGNGDQKRIIASAVQARLLDWLCKATGFAGYVLPDVLRRPCGCALAATHMAQLCAALDGGDAFGAARPEVLVMPAWESREFGYLERKDRKAKQYDDVAMRLQRAVNLHAAISTGEAWIALLSTSTTLPEQPCTRGDGACSTEAGAEQEATGASQEAVSVGREEAKSGGPDARPGPEEKHTAADMCLHKLPPYNRTATFHLCLRLAKGVMACWGRPLSGVRLELPCDNPNAPAPLLPKEQSCALLHATLACARLALLPAVWGREQVPRRTWAQLRAWWETYVAAARHPEALLVGEPEVSDYSDWTTQHGVFGARPSADAAAAIGAGLLPCLIPLVNRMGADGAARAVWCLLNTLPEIGPCLADVLQFGHLGHVGQLVSAMGARLRWAVGELEGVGAEESRGERAWWLADVVRRAMRYTGTFLCALFLRWLSVHTDEAGADSAGPGTGHLTQRPDSCAPAAAAAAAQFPLRSSFALAELLPALSASVRLCGELVASVAGGEGWARERGGGGIGDMAAERRRFMGLVELVGCGCSAAVTAMDCVIALLAILCQEAAAEPLGSCGGGGGCSAASVAAGCGGGGSPSCVRDGAPEMVWRQLLLRDVRLMELLGAGVAMHGELSRAEAAVLLPPGLRHRPDVSLLRNRLAATLQLAAFTFPAEFRAAVEGGAAAAGAKAEVGPAEAGRGAAPSPRSCMSLAAVQAVLELEAAQGGQGCGAGGDVGQEVLARVLAGWDPAPGEAWDLARRCTTMYELGLEEVVAVMCGMHHPEEARAAVAAAAAAAADASGSGPA